VRITHGSDNRIRREATRQRLDDEAHVCEFEPAGRDAAGTCGLENDLPELSSGPFAGIRANRSFSILPPIHQDSSP
jgi:hypothetical protein